MLSQLQGPDVSHVLVPAQTDQPTFECWCVNRKGSSYTELLRLVLETPPGVGKPLHVKFRGSLQDPIASVVGLKGRRGFAFLPREDARLFAALGTESSSIIKVLGSWDLGGSVLHNFALHGVWG